MMDLDVIVVGGGIGGLAVSLLLGRAGASVTMLERAPAIADVGAGLLLQPNGLAVLDGLGLRGAVEARGRILTSAAVRDERGRIISDMATPDFGAGLDHMVAVRRSVLHEVLHGALAGEPDVSCRFACTATSVDSTGTVDIDWEGRASTLTANLVVGADGVNSVVRGGGDFKSVQHPASDRYIRGLVPARGHGVTGEYWTSLGLFGGSQVDERTLYFYASAHADEVSDAIDEQDLVGLKRAWSRVPAAGPVFELVESFDHLLVNEVVRVDCGVWFDGRLVLIGDAAHAMAPTLGQGANSALVDAAVLTEELVSETTMSTSLARYDARRSAKVKRVQDRAESMARATGRHSATYRLVRDSGLRLMGRIPGLSRRLVASVQQEDPADLVGRVRALNTRGPGRP